MRLQCLEAAAGPPGVVTGSEPVCAGRGEAGEAPCGLLQEGEQTEQRGVSAFLVPLKILSTGSFFSSGSLALTRLHKVLPGFKTLERTISQLGTAGC